MRRSMEESYAIDDQYKIRYFDLEQKVYKYAMEFFMEAVPYFNDYGEGWDKTLTDEILPLYCYDEMNEIMRAALDPHYTPCTGGFESTSRKQAVIKICISGRTGMLRAELKRTIRHEILHYILWAREKGYHDNDLDFWCAAYAFDAHPYARLTKANRERFNIFKNTYDKHIRGFEKIAIKAFMMQSMIKHIHDEDLSGYEEMTLNDLDVLKHVFSLIEE